MRNRRERARLLAKLIGTGETADFVSQQNGARAKIKKNNEKKRETERKRERERGGGEREGERGREKRRERKKYQSSPSATAVRVIFVFCESDPRFPFFPAAGRSERVSGMDFASRQKHEKSSNRETRREGARSRQAVLLRQRINPARHIFHDISPLKRTGPAPEEPARASGGEVWKEKQTGAEIGNEEHRARGVMHAGWIPRLPGEWDFLWTLSLFFPFSPASD